MTDKPKLTLACCETCGAELVLVHDEQNQVVCEACGAVDPPIPFPEIRVVLS